MTVLTSDIESKEKFSLTSASSPPASQGASLGNDTLAADAISTFAGIAMAECIAERKHQGT